MFDVAVHRRSVSSTRENRTEPRFDFNTPVKSAGNKQTCGRGHVCHDTQDSQHQKQTSTQPETMPLSSRKPQNGSQSGTA